MRGKARLALARILSPTGATRHVEVAKKNYDDCVSFSFYRLKDGNLEDYLARVHKQSMDYGHFGTDRSFDKLEVVHEAFMSS